VTSRASRSPALRRTVLAVGATVAAVAAGFAAGLPASELAVLDGGHFVTWWRSASAPARWPVAEPAVTRALAWTRLGPGVELAELTIAGTGEAWRLRVVVARLDPARLRFELVEASREAGTLADWTIDALPAGAVLGVNAGQFSGGRAWGWLVRGGRQAQPPGAGPLSMAFCVLADGAIRLVPVDGIPAAAEGAVAWAFQSYPVLLGGDGEVPAQLAGPGLGVDLAHRDARLAIGELRDGRVLVALTRFAAAGDALGSLPFGPTVPETVALMGALGCRRALALDGGISAQLALRDGSGALHAWRGWRRVPLGLVAFPR